MIVEQFETLHINTADYVNWRRL